jgi:hypothetical protein
MRTSRAREVLEGALDPFLLAYLKQRAELPAEEQEDGDDSASQTRAPDD